MVEIVKNINFASPEWVLILPLVLIGIDFVTGLIYSFLSRTFRSSKMRAGLSKKFGEIIIIIVAELLTVALGLPDEIINFIVFYISLMEIMSIFENVDKMGVPVPKFIKRSINNVTSDESLEKAVEELKEGKNE